MKVPWKRIAIAAGLVALSLALCGCASIAGYEMDSGRRAQKALLVGAQAGQVTVGVNLSALDYLKEHPVRALVCGLVDGISAKAIYEYAKGRDWFGLGEDGGGGDQPQGAGQVDTGGGDFIYIAGDGNAIRQDRTRK